MVKKTMQATQKLPTAKADIRPEDAKKPDPVTEEREDDTKTEDAGFSYLNEPDRLPSDADQAAMTAEAKAIHASLNAGNYTGPMSLADVNAILADEYPGYTPTDPRGDASGLTFTLPDGKALKIERKRVKACANMEELRAYVGGLL